MALLITLFITSSIWWMLLITFVLIMCSRSPFREPFRETSEVHGPWHVSLSGNPFCETGAWFPERVPERVPGKGFPEREACHGPWTWEG